MVMDDYHDIFETIVNNVSARSLFEMLAEEATELAQAALKVIRTLEGSDNPTPVHFYEAMNNLEEELTDVKLSADLLGIDIQNDVYLKKVYRWKERIEEYEKSKKSK